MSMFRLGDVQMSAIRAVGKLEEIREYNLRGLQVQKVKPNGSISSGDSQYIFNIDSAVLSGNIPLNLMEATVKYRVTATGTATDTMSENYASGGTELVDKPPVNKYLISPSNSAFEAFCVNSSFSTVDVSDKNSNLVQETRNPERIQILSRLLDKDLKEQHGIYEHDGYGSVTQQYGGAWELLPLLNPNASGLTGHQNAYQKGCSPKEICESVFWKRNTNNRYIVAEASNFTFNGTPVDSSEYATSTPSPYEWTYRNMANWRQGKNTDNLTVYPHYDLIKDGTIGGQQVVVQTKEYTVTEDIMHDILVTRYQNESATAFPTNQLVLTFTKSDKLNSLFKCSNTNVTDIKVEIIDFYLTIITFNYGLLEVPVDRDFNVGFFSEVTDQEQVTLSASASTPYTTQQRQYNSVPLYLMAYTNVPNKTDISQNRSSSLQTAKHDSVRLSLGFDSGNPLYNMTVDQIKERTLRNLGRTLSNEKALFEHVPLNAGNVQDRVRGANTPEGKLGMGTFLLDNQDQVGVAVASSNGCNAVERSLLDGLILLRVGEDIRLPSDIVPGLNRKTSWTWHFDYSPVDNEYASYLNDKVACTIYTTAFFPSEYILSMGRGLVKGGNITFSEAEFTSMWENTNRSLADPKLRSNELYFSAKHPLMVGSGFANILEIARARLPMIKNIVRSVANMASEVSGQFDSDLARSIKKGADAVKSFLAEDKAGARAKPKKGRPLKVAVRSR